MVSARRTNDLPAPGFSPNTATSEKRRSPSTCIPVSLESSKATIAARTVKAVRDRPTSPCDAALGFSRRPCRWRPRRPRLPGSGGAVTGARAR
eukprot:scaffold565712_cov13-Prasinocladus_malaysianus.AAC.1